MTFVKQVVINDRTYSATDLDREFQNTTNFKVERSRDWIVVTGTKKGVKVGCSTLHDVCAVKVSGFYHGKVLGLLGKFNQEKFDDLTTPDGKVGRTKLTHWARNQFCYNFLTNASFLNWQISENTNEFTESWKLNSGCRERPVISLPVITSEASQRCSDAFESRASTLRYVIVTQIDNHSINTLIIDYWSIIHFPGHVLESLPHKSINECVKGYLPHQDMMFLKPSALLLPVTPRLATFPTPVSSYLRNVAESKFKLLLIQS